MALSTQDKDQIRNFGVLSVIAVGFLIFGPFPEQGIGIWKLRDLAQKEKGLLEQEKRELDEENRRIDRIRLLEQELEEREPEIRRYEARLPKSQKVPELFKDIDRFKQQSDLDITVQTRLEPVDKEDYLELRIRVQARGNYDSIATFINSLERNQRFAQIKELEINEFPGDNPDEDLIPEDLSVHDVEMVLSTFMFVDPVTEGEENSS